MKSEHPSSLQLLLAQHLSKLTKVTHIRSGSLQAIGILFLQALGHVKDQTCMGS